MSRSRLSYACLRLILVACALVVIASTRPEGGVYAQNAPLTEVDGDTQVGNISFRFVDGQTFTEARLKEHISHTERGRLVGLRRVFGFLPFVQAVGVHPFIPVELARDRVRLERFYVRNGFLFPEVDWLVSLDGETNRVNILFSVLEGPPLLIESLDFRGTDGQPAREHVAPELREEWDAFRRQAVLQEGQRLAQLTLIELEEQALSWTRDRGYPFSRVASTTAVDTLRSAARVTLEVEPGPRARIASISVEDNERVRDRVIVRELPFAPGELFSHRRLIAGQREVFGLNIIQLALVDVPPQEADSTVDIRVRVREHDLHAVTAQVGYMTEAGLMGQAEWMHRNFLGDARTFTASGIANTGLLSTRTVPDRRFRVNVNLHQPYLLHRNVAATATGFAERRRDFRDDSRAFGGELSLLYERGPFRSAAVSYEFEDRRLLEPPVAPFVIDWVATGVPTPTDPDAGPGASDVLDLDVSRSMLNLHGTFGVIDNPIDPRRGYVLRPALQMTVPLPYTRLEYQRARLTASGYLPLGERLRLAGRASVGRLFVGARPATEEEAFVELIRMRDAVFLAGGTADVRGWATGMMGPKVLDAFPTEEREVEGQTTILGARRFFAYGGTMRTTATAEVRYDLTPSLGALAFVDAGRLWTPQESFDVPEDHPLFDSAYDDPHRIFVGTGAGVTFASPIGGIQVSLGYKINPSFFDVRSPDAVAAAIGAVLHADPNAGDEAVRQAVQAVEPSTWRRFRLHIAIGQIF